jgi:hypothetical protein
MEFKGLLEINITVTRDKMAIAQTNNTMTVTDHNSLVFDLYWGLSCVSFGLVALVATKNERSTNNTFAWKHKQYKFLKSIFVTSHLQNHLLQVQHH